MGWLQRAFRIVFWFDQSDADRPGYDCASRKVYRQKTCGWHVAWKPKKDSGDVQSSDEIRSQARLYQLQPGQRCGASKESREIKKV